MCENEEPWAVLPKANFPADVVYWRDEQDIHHVPKRPLDELIVKF